MIDLGQLVGKEYGGFYQVTDPKSGNIVKITDVKELTAQYLDNDIEVGGDVEGEEEEKVSTVITSGKDNRDINDNNQAQKMTHEEIEELKKKGMTGNELISKIIENSETFNKRTKFSQEKYLRKKKQKYEVRFQVKKPTALELCEAHHSTQPGKLLGIRPDTFGLMLQMANINYESRVLLVDKTKGFIAGALIERQVPEILHVEVSQNTQLKMNCELLFEYDFPQYLHRKVSFTHLNNLIKDENQSNDPLFKALSSAKEAHYNSLIIVHDEFHPLEIYQNVEYMLQGSSTIVVFSLYMNPLAELKEWLLSQKAAVNIRIEELWMREYQVLPMRTHPEMSMDGTSGFVLSAIKIF